MPLTDPLLSRSGLLSTYLRGERDRLHEELINKEFDLECAELSADRLGNEVLEMREKLARIEELLKGFE